MPASAPTDSPKPGDRRFEALAESSPVGIFEMDGEGNCTYANARASEMTGVPVPEMRGREWARYLHPEDRARLKDNYYLSIGRGEPFAAEYRFVHPSGRTVWVFGQGVPLHDAQGRLTGFVGTITDLTERKRIEEELAGKETRLRLMLEQVPAIVWTTDSMLHCTSSLGKGLAQVNLLPNQLVGMDLYEQFKAEPTPLDAHVKALDGILSSYEYGWMEHIFQTHIEPLRNARGQIIGTIGLALDISERKRAEDKLQEMNEKLEMRVAERTLALSVANDALQREIFEREVAVKALHDSELRLAGILNSQQTLVARADLNGHLTYVNDAYAQAFGLKIGDTFLGTVHPEDRERTTRFFNESFHAPYRNAFECRRLIGGEWRWVSWQNAVITDRAGLPVEVQGVGFDIHDRKLAEQRLRQSEEHFRDLSRELDHRVGNNLAGLLSLVSLMRHKTRDVDEMASALEARLQAMAHIHRLLSETAWQEVDLKTLIDSLLSAIDSLACHPIPVTMKGPPIAICATRPCRWR